MSSWNPLDKCPRCGHVMGDMHPALSRLSRGKDDEQRWVCSPCGVEEAIEAYANNGVVYDWRK